MKTVTTKTREEIESFNSKTLRELLSNLGIKKGISRASKSALVEMVLENQPKEIKKLESKKEKSSRLSGKSNKKSVSATKDLANGVAPRGRFEHPDGIKEGQEVIVIMKDGKIVK